MVDGYHLPSAEIVREGSMTQRLGQSWQGEHEQEFKDCPRCEGGWMLVDDRTDDLNCNLCYDNELLPPVPYTELINGILS